MLTCGSVGFVGCGLLTILPSWEAVGFELQTRGLETLHVGLWLSDFGFVYFSLQTDWPGFLIRSDAYLGRLGYIDRSCGLDTYYEVDMKLLTSFFSWRLDVLKWIELHVGYLRDLFCWMDKSF